MVVYGTCRLTDSEKINFCIESIAKFNEKAANELKSIVTEYNITYDVFEKHFGLERSHLDTHDFPAI